MKELTKRASETGNSHFDHQERDDQRRDIFNSPVPERMLLVRRLARHFYADKADDRRRGVRKIVQGIRHDRQRIHQQPDHQFCTK